MTPTFHRRVATKPETCWRCLQLGLPPNGIEIGEEFILCTSDSSEKTIASCVDCYNRMVEEIQSQSEGEAWKQI